MQRDLFPSCITISNPTRRQILTSCAASEAMVHREQRAPLRLILSNSSLLIVALITLLALNLAYMIVNVIYFVTLSPLAKIPGPKLCAITRIPYWLEYIRGNDVKWMHSLHIKYGPVLRFGPTDVSYAFAEAWKDVHGQTKGHGELKKAQEFLVQPINGPRNHSYKACSASHTNSYI